MIVMKFGGTSVQDTAAINRLISIVRGRLPDKPLVVVSAMAKVTRLLMILAQDAESQQVDKVREGLDILRDRHNSVVNELLSEEELSSCLEKISNTFVQLEDFLLGVAQIGELSPRSRAKILAFGEFLSSIIVGAAFNSQGIKCKWVDAKRLIITDDNYLSAKPDMELSISNINRIIPESLKGVELVITQGFIASSTKGDTTVLGFEGSDYSAAIFGRALGAERVEIWTDVDGIRTSDPRLVSYTKKIDRISYEEAAEMAFLGARVLHPLTIEPCSEKNIPIYVLNSSNSKGKGTLVFKADSVKEGCKAITFRKDIDYLEVCIERFSGITSSLSSIMLILSKYNIQVSLLSVDEAKIGLTLESGQTGCEDCYRELEERYKSFIYRDKAQISLTGKNVVLQEKLMDSLYKVIPESLMFAVGSSKMNISVVLEKVYVDEAVIALHKILFD